MINEQIRDREVRVIGPNGEQLGIMSAKEAYFKAKDAGLDLVKIAPTAKPPVCKIIDYGKYRYDMGIVIIKPKFMKNLAAKTFIIILAVIRI